jgi:hypothetical protein
VGETKIKEKGKRKKEKDRKPFNHKARKVGAKYAKKNQTKSFVTFV